MKIMEETKSGLTTLDPAYYPEGCTIMDLDVPPNEDGRHAWLERRKSLIGASEVAAVLGADPRRGPLHVYEAKVTGYSIEDNIWMAYGRDVESAIAKMYAYETGETVYDLGATSIQIHPDYPFIGATLDRSLDRGPLELKSVDPYGAKMTANQFREDPPLQYQIQLQIQMACVGADEGVLAGLFPGYQLAIYEAKRDNDLLDLAYPILEDFWKRVQDRNPPPTDNLSGTLDVVKRLYPSTYGTTIQFSNLEIVDRWELIKKQEKELANEKKIIEARIRAEMGDNEFGILGDGTMLTLKETLKKAYTVKVEESTYRTLRRSRIK